MRRIGWVVGVLVGVLFAANLFVDGGDSAMQSVAREKGATEGWPPDKQQLVHSECDTGFFGVGGYGIVDLRLAGTDRVLHIEMRKRLNLLGWAAVSVRELQSDKQR